MNTSVKLHIMLVIIIIGLMFYMHMMNKSLNIFQSEISLLKAKVNSLLPIDIQKIDEQVKNMMKKKDDKELYENNIDDILSEDDEDDNHSVSTTEIKNIIDDIEEEEEEEEKVKDNVQVDIPITEKCENNIIDGTILDGTILDDTFPTQKEQHPFTTLSFEDLCNERYEDLRIFLKETGKSTKGNKQDLAKRIIEYNS